MSAGGHFAAFEEPKMLVDDIRAVPDLRLPRAPIAGEFVAEDHGKPLPVSSS
jgi:hypothetical protein